MSFLYNIMFMYGTLLNKYLLIRKHLGYDCNSMNWQMAFVKIQEDLLEIERYSYIEVY